MSCDSWLVSACGATKETVRACSLSWYFVGTSATGLTGAAAEVALLVSVNMVFCEINSDSFTIALVSWFSYHSDTAHISGPSWGVVLTKSKDRNNEGRTAHKST